MVPLPLPMRAFMRLAEATSTDGRASLKPGAQRAIDSVTAQFATVLSATRRSSARLLDMLKTGATPDGGSRLPREQARPEETSGRTGPDKASSAARKQARSTRSDRPEPAESEPREELQPQQSEPPPQSVDEGGRSLPAAAQVHSCDDRPSSGGEPTGLVTNSSSTAEAASSTGGTVVGAPAASGSGSVTGSAADPGTVGVVQVGHATTSPPTPAPAVAPPGAATPPVAATASGEGSSTGTMESASAGIAGKAAASKSTGSAGDFQQLLQHLGRSRFGESAGSVTSPAKGLRGHSAAPETIDMQSTESVEELARVVRSQAGSRASSMALTMAPEELGRLRIDVQMQDDGVRLRFETQTSAGHEAITGKLDDLKHALEQQGIRVDRVEVEYVPPAPSSQRHDAEQPSYGGHPWEMGGRQHDTAGQARQSFDETRHGGSGLGQFGDDAIPAAIGVIPAAVDWTRPGVDVIA